MAHDKTVIAFTSLIILLVCVFVFAICICIALFIHHNNDNDYLSFNSDYVNSSIIDNRKCSHINDTLRHCKPLTVFIPWINVVRHLRNIYDKHIPKHVNGSHIAINRCLYFMTQSCLYDEFCLMFSQINTEKYGNITLRNNTVKKFKIVVREDSECLCTNDRYLKKRNPNPWKIPIITNFDFV